LAFRGIPFFATGVRVVTSDSKPGVILKQMDQNEAIEEISRIEAQLEGLAEVSERCRKIALVSKAAIAGGVVLPILMVLGLFESSEVAAIGSIAAVLGGIVSLGSNASTLRQTMAVMKLAEARRSDMIGRIESPQMP
jgi:hypothetical protein